jgi:subtilisin family serine protease
MLRSIWPIILIFGADAVLAAQTKQMPLDEFVRLADSLPLPHATPLREMVPPDTGADGRFPVIVHAAGIGQVRAASDAIRNAGGEVTASFEATIWARVSPAASKMLAESSAVISVSDDPTLRIAPELAPEPVSGGRSTAMPGDGVRAAHLQQLHARGITGKGVRLGVLDLGFGGYARLLRDRRVKPAISERAFPASNGIENGEIHGTACLEVISAAAPGADLYLASFDGSSGQFVQAAQWLIQMGVQVINYSLGNASGPNDGTDEISRFVDQTTRANDMLWVVAAGNHAVQHWAGQAETTGESDIVQLAPLAFKGLGVQALGPRLRIVVRSSREFGAYLYALNEDGALYEVARSGRSAVSGAAVVETIDLREPALNGREFFLILRAQRFTQRALVHIFLEPGGSAILYPATAAGSVLNPASARLAVAVGAFDVVTADLAPSSSQGPTDDNRLKPEVTAPANTVSWAYAARFPGTSAACAHVAGLAALLKQEHPRASAIELRSLLLRTVAPKGQPSPNSRFGYGQVDAAVARSPFRDLMVTALPDHVAVPPEFGDSLDAETLAALRGKAGQWAGKLAVRVFAALDVFHIGDALHVGVSATEDCECLLLVRDATGRYALLARPNLRAGALRMLPEGLGEDWTISGPVGMDELTLACARQPAALQSAESVAVGVDAYTVLNRWEYNPAAR